MPAGVAVEPDAERGALFAQTYGAAHRVVPALATPDTLPGIRAESAGGGAPHSGDTLEAARASRIGSSCGLRWRRDIAIGTIVIVSILRLLLQK